MKNLASLAIFVVLFEVIEPRGIPLSASIGKCAPVNMTFCNGINQQCINGVLTINGKGYKNIKPSDKVEITFNELRVNNKLVEKIPPAAGSGNSPFVKNNSSKSSSLSLSDATVDNKCPPVARFNCKNISYSCINGQLHINGQKIKNVKSSDKVIVVENDLRINGEFIRHFPDPQADDDDDDEEEEEEEEEEEVDEDEEEEEEEADEDEEEEADENEDEEEEDGEEVDEEEEADEDEEEEDGEEVDEDEEADEDEEEEDGEEVDEDEEEEEADEDEEEEGKEVDEEEVEEEADEDEEEYEDEEEFDGDEDEEEEIDEDEEDDDDEEDDKPIKNNNTGIKIQDFSNMKITCRGCSGTNMYWMNGKFYVNDVQIKNFKREDELLIAYNKVFVNNKFNTYV